MSIKVADIKAPIAEELKTFEKKFKDAMKSNVALLDKVTYYIVQRKGKQVRPMFIFLSAKMCGEVTEKSYVAASLVELLHTATLVHDDVVDDSYERRGFFSINALWKNKIAVLVGDYLLSRGLMHSLETGNYDLLHIVTDAVRKMSEGELLQMEKARKLDIDEEVYYEIIRNKTASLIASACMAGAASATADKELIDKFHEMGEMIGMSFQIKDDLFDYGEADIGKPRGIDIKEKKMTLPLIYALNNSTKKEKRWIINTVKNHNEDRKRVKKLIEMVRAKGGIDYTTQKMYEYKDKAMAILETIPASPARLSMMQLIDYITERNY